VVFRGRGQGDDRSGWGEPHPGFVLKVTRMALSPGLGTRCLRAPAMAVATGVPAGHGHVYVADVANGWAAVLQPPGWTPEKTAKLRPLLHASDT
jgi:Alpha/beta-hydrolase family